MFKCSFIANVMGTFIRMSESGEALEKTLKQLSHEPRNLKIPQSHRKTSESRYFKRNSSTEAKDKKEGAFT